MPEDIVNMANVHTQTIDTSAWKGSAAVDVLRLDLLHPVISGNKWFKLKYYLQDAKEKGYEEIVTYGGAWSNHIAATAYACRQFGCKSIGIIRGEEPSAYSATLQQAKAMGMQLRFVSRSDYKNKAAIDKQFKHAYIIPEGGYGMLGAKGAAEILQCCMEPEKYSHIVCAAGTGTMMAGLIQAASHHQQVMGINVLKGNNPMKEISALLNDEDKTKQFKIYQQFHFGGYAKHPAELTEFMKLVWYKHQLPTDIVYTSKTFFGLQQLIADNTIPPGSRVLMIHSGGLQGNASLPAGALPF